VAKSDFQRHASNSHKEFLSSFQKSHPAVIYIVEGHEKARGLTESIPYISKMAIGNAGMECRNSKRVPPFSLHLFRKGKKISVS
jgi:hypothetical protein